jgi:hypothetical protein
VLKLKAPWGDGTTHLVVSPLEFMQRLVSPFQRPCLLLSSGAARLAALRRPIQGSECREGVEA